MGVRFTRQRSTRAVEIGGGVRNHGVDADSHENQESPVVFLPKGGGERYTAVRVVPTCGVCVAPPLLAPVMDPWSCVGMFNVDTPDNLAV